jgi:hypothetical protein
VRIIFTKKKRNSKNEKQPIIQIYYFIDVLEIRISLKNRNGFSDLTNKELGSKNSIPVFENK